MRTKGSELAPSKPTLSDPPLSGSEDVPALQTRVDPDSENSQAPPKTSLRTAPEGVSFDEVAREALKATEEIFRKEDTSATPNPRIALVEDPHLSVEDFLAQKRANPTPSESDDQLKPASPASASTQVTLRSACPAPIIIDDGK